MLTHRSATEVKPTRVVVMGAGGFVGEAICRRLRVRGVTFLQLGRHDIDLRAPGAARTLAQYLTPEDAFIAVSAIAPVKTLSMLRENLTMIEAMSDALMTQPVAHVLNIGSDAVYQDKEGPLSESDCLSPGSWHGIMHLTRELALRDAAGDTPFATLRPTLIYGANDPHNGYGPNRFRRLASEGQTITLFGQGEERRDHVWVDDVGELAVRIVMHRSCGALNAATGTVMSFAEIAEAVAELFPHPVAIKGTPRSGPMPHNGYRPFDPAATHAAFRDFEYVLPRDGFARVQAALEEAG